MTLRLVYGGTFDPVHCGHLAIARAARDTLGCPVVLMPAGDPPHRATPGADAAQRAAMLALAIEGEAGLRLDTRELRRAGRSYTVDTLAALRRECGDAAPIAWLVGADSLRGLPGWHRWTSMFALAHLVVADRPGSDLGTTLPRILTDALSGRWAATPADLLAAPAGRILRLHQPLHAASATEVRSRVARGVPLAGLVPDAVAAFIEEKGLYRPRTGASL